MGLFSGITKSLFGSGGEAAAGDAVQRAQELGKDVSFKPYTVTTSLGGSQYDPTTGQITSSLDPRLAGIQSTALTGAGSMFGQAASFDPTQRAQDIFSQQAAMLQPQFEQQRQQMQQDLFGSGRLGMRLAGGAAGAGEGTGMVQPDAFGLGLAQQQTLAGLAADSRSQAFQEQGQLQDLATNMLSAGMSPAQMEQNLIGLGADIETARSAAAAARGTLELSPYEQLSEMQSKNRDDDMNLTGTIAKSLFSDARLKDNIKLTNVLPNGISVYSWTWKDKSINQPTFGVLAQDLLEVLPEAVKLDASGFYKVDYSHPELDGVYNVEA